jgi:hypothetical protein
MQKGWRSAIDVEALRWISYFAGLARPKFIIAAWPSYLGRQEVIRIRRVEAVAG